MLDVMHAHEHTVPLMGSLVNERCGCGVHIYVRFMQYNMSHAISTYLAVLEISWNTVHEASFVCME